MIKSTIVTPNAVIFKIFVFCTELYVNVAHKINIPINGTKTNINKSILDKL